MNNIKSQQIIIRDTIGIKIDFALHLQIAGKINGKVYNEITNKFQQHEYNLLQRCIKDGLKEELNG